jgi:diguanylate cyclase (GGDEF)-like protein
MASALSKKVIAALEHPSEAMTSWRKRVAELERRHGAEVYRILFYTVAHLDFSPAVAKTHWKKLLEIWRELDRRTGAELDLRVAALHYFLQIQKKLKNPAVVEIKFLKKAEDSVVVDELTRIYNYRYFQHRIEQEMKRVRRYDRGLSLLMIDVDDFKWFNDRNGHLTGNQTLRRLARVLVSCVREVDVVCRYGGEEFAVILPTTLKSGALTVAEKMRLKVESARFPGENKQPKGKLTVSIGVATAPTDAGDIEALIERADAALYRAKARGKNRVEAFSDERREFVRFDTLLQGQYRALDRTPISFRTSNISQGGLLFRTRAAVPVGSIVSLDLALPSDSRTWEATVRVVRVEELEDEYEVGVKIVHVEGGDLYRFQSYLEALRAGREPATARRPQKNRKSTSASKTPARKLKAM